MADRVWQLHNLDDIGFAIRLAASPHCAEPGYVADFEVYELVVWRDKDGTPERHYRQRDAVSDTDVVDRVEDAELFAEGGIKWDGCCEFELKTPNPHHMCGRGDGERFGKMIVAIWDLAAKFLEQWDHGVAGTVKDG